MQGIILLLELRMRTTLLRMRITLLRMRITLPRMRITLLRMRITLLRMRITLLRMRITLLRMRSNLEKPFTISGEIGQKTEFIPARPDHQNVKKNQKIFS